MSIPRLELLTILIGIRVAKFVMKQLELEKLPVVLWSECALHWIQNRSKIATQIHPEQDREEQMITKVSKLSTQTVEEAWLPFVDASRFKMRNKFWIPKGKMEVKHLISDAQDANVG
ncbi:Integrase core domain containing protein [Dirofilaria immitis]|nr:Integrase core domain containing protein [Dirofilaria immitis]